MIATTIQNGKPSTTGMIGLVLAVGNVGGQISNGY